jgi:hypothetical protein
MVVGTIDVLIDASMCVISVGVAGNFLDVYAIVPLQEFEVTTPRSDCAASNTQGIGNQNEQSIV